MHDWLHRVWYGRRPEAALLWPLSIVFRSAAAARRCAYSSGALRVHDPGAPVVVVGNITAGGTGKTPLVIWLATRLTAAGRQPGVVTRGYGGRGLDEPRLVTAGSDPHAVGDESVLLASRCDCPVAAGADRVAAARRLVAEGVDLVISDDGLQHYRLGRSFEIAVVDGARGLGNGLPLPAGPLREPASRLTEVDAVVENLPPGATATPPRLTMHLEGDLGVNLVSGERRSLAAFSGLEVHALAGIGDPGRFFRHLERQGLRVIEHPLPDHARLAVADLQFGDRLPILMTEKDAVKCRDFASDMHWYVPVEAVFDEAGGAELLRRLQIALGDALAPPGQDTGSRAEHG
ncbi:tetraacyldisaccharide 4'-kinase [soil metagenome]